jgi:hypothetical protein
MLQAIRRHLNPSTAIALIALVFALTGGAFAATGGGSPSHATLTASAAKTKAKVKAGPRGPAGPKGATGATGAAGATGATGATGPGGPAGAKGENGAPGAAGATGQQGERGPQGEPGEGIEGKQGKEGKQGAIHPGETLPEGATETGTWTSKVFENVATGSSPEAISFPIQLAEGLTSEHVFYVTVGEQEAKSGPVECAGSVEEPEATAGNLCVYEGFSRVEGAAEPGDFHATEIRIPGSHHDGAGKAGAIVSVSYAGPANEVSLVAGSWAVTAP